MVPYGSCNLDLDASIFHSALGYPPHNCAAVLHFVSTFLTENFAEIYQFPQEKSYYLKPHFFHMAILALVLKLELAWVSLHGSALHLVKSNTKAGTFIITTLGYLPSTAWCDVGILRGNKNYVKL